VNARVPDTAGAIIVAAGGLTFSAVALWGARFLPPFAVLPLPALILVAGCYVGYMTDVNPMFRAPCTRWTWG
jgi:hypothetical protein